MGIKKSKAANEALDTLLLEVGGTEKKKITKKKIIISSVALVLVAAITTGTIFIVKSKKKGSSEPIYREYTVQRGNIIVGQTESSVITLNKEDISFPVGAEVLELYIKSGSEVKEGDPLVKMSIDDINEAILDYQADIESAKAEVSNAKINRETELQKARQTMEQSVLNGTQADDAYARDLAQAELDLADAQKQYDDVKEKYDDLTKQNRNFNSDYTRLTYYEEKMEDAAENAEYWSDLQESYNEIKSQLSEIESKIKQIADVSNMDQAEAYLTQSQNEYKSLCEKSGSGSLEAMKAKEKLDNLEDSMDTLESLFEEKEKIDKKLSEYDADEIASGVKSSNKALEKAKDNYNDFNDDFKETYGQITTLDQMKSSLSDAKTSYNKAKLNLEKQKDKYEAAILQAEQTKDSSNLSATNAVQTYNLKKIELDQKVKDATEKYDSLVEELAEIKESLGNKGVISAPCDGIVSSLNVEVGDEVSAGNSDSMFGSSSTTLMTITDMSEANISVSISEDEILDVSLDQEASIELSAFPDETFDGIVDSISVEGATIGAATVTYTVNVKFTQEGHELYDGMSADVTLIDGSAIDVLYLSKQAVSTKDGKSYVQVKDSNGNGVETSVKTGFTDGQYIEILSGLNEGDIVLAESSIGKDASSQSGKMPDIDQNFDFSDFSMPSGGFNGMAGVPQ